jgi:translation initiation factor IF-3
VIAPDGEQLGIKPLSDALSLARELELDLVEVADKASPPVVRIMDYGKYKYEAAQKAKESRRKTTNVTVKEMKYRPKISGGDFETKTRKVEQFLREGHKVKITIMFRGREMQHPDLGKKILDEVADDVAEVSKVEAWPKLDGRNMIMVLAPDKSGRPAKARPAPPTPEAIAAAIANSTTEAPATEAPATEAPATEAPATEAPATEAPATEAPATEAPATEAPATEAPATEAPADGAPSTEVPSGDA